MLAMKFALLLTVLSFTSLHFPVLSFYFASLDACVVVVSGLDLLARMNAMLNDDSLELIDEIRSACKVAIEILNDLLTYEKLDSNILVLERSVYDLFDILRKVCDMFAIPARFSDINLSMSYDENLTCAMVDVDAAKISQVFRNLISNALKFTPFGGTVSVHVGLVGKVVRVQVRDSGVGMKLDEKQRLFGEIIQFNAKNLQGGGGSGMGLYLCGRIISIHEGAIGVDMEYDGPGTVFYCDLPLVSRDKPTSNLGMTRCIYFHPFTIALPSLMSLEFITIVRIYIVMFGVD